MDRRARDGVTSEFFTRHLDRRRSLTLTDRPADTARGTESGLYVVADGAGIEVGGTRLIPLPGFEGRVDRIPIRSIDVGYDDNRGVEVLDRVGPDGARRIRAGPGPRRPAARRRVHEPRRGRGHDVPAQRRPRQRRHRPAWNLRRRRQRPDELGRDVPFDGGGRGIVDATWQTPISGAFNLQTQFAYVSDETFVSSWRQRDFENRLEYESSAYLNGVSGNTAFSALLKHDVNDFISNSYLLASRGYSVDKLPELAYRRYGDNVFDGVSWTQQWSANMMRIRPTSGTPASLGVPTGAWGGALAPTQPIDLAYFAAGYDDGYVSRLDTRQEISIPLTSDWITVTPFATGEATGYLFDEFERYSVNADSLRFQTGAGVRGSMRFMRLYDSVQSRLFDLNRLRHLIEPYATLWAGWDSLEEGSLPVYDQAFEGTSGGAAVNLGVRNTLQTQRGGSGAWQSVDWLKLDLGLVVNDGSSDFTPQPVNPLNPNSSLRWSQSPTPVFYSFRPELSQWGSHGYGSAVWQLSDSLTAGGTMVYLFDDANFVTRSNDSLRNLARGSLGLEMRHNPAVSTYLEYRYLAPTDSELLQAGFLYRVGTRYLIAFSPQYDLQENDFRSIGGSITRTYPDFDLNANVGYDLVKDNTFIGLSLSIPAGSRVERQSFGAYTPSIGGTR